MKTVSCDICGRTPEQLLDKGFVRIKVNKFSWSVFGLHRTKHEQRAPFYICDQCLKAITHEMQKKMEEDLNE